MFLAVARGSGGEGSRISWGIPGGAIRDSDDGLYGAQKMRDSMNKHGVAGLFEHICVKNDDSMEIYWVGKHMDLWISKTCFMLFVYVC